MVIYIYPQNVYKKMPAVIIQHGSGSSKRSFYSRYARALNKVGIIAHSS